MRAALVALLIWMSAASSISAQGFTALARVLADESQIADSGYFDVSIDLSLSQAVPFRVFTLDTPPRLVLDFQEVDWSTLAREEFRRSDRVAYVEFGAYVPGWSRMVIELAEPMAVVSVEMRTDTGAGHLHLMLSPTSPDRFAANTGAPQDAKWDLPDPSQVSVAPSHQPDAPMVVMLDPGHGGIDPGAQAADLDEKHVTLAFARELRDELLRAGHFIVLMTRDEDRFVSLERRVALAHRGGADVFLSLHADALAEGVAHGASVHLLASEASDLASEKLAERHDRGDILAGVDLSRTDDEVTGILLGLARRETQPRTELLARDMIEAFQGSGKRLISRPLRRANYSVLKAADIPSILIELGFMSSPKDLERLTDPEWRAGMARAIRVGLEDWRRNDELRQPLVRQ
jgi:N-acetylmuramoyl-L-alanine amidase